MGGRDRVGNDPEPYRRPQQRRPLRPASARRSRHRQPPLTEVVTWLKRFLRLVPTRAMAPPQAMAISATIWPYSTIVAPSSWAMIDLTWLNNGRMGAPPDAIIG